MEDPKAIRDVVVIGGGLAGLAAAAYASRAGLDTVVLERRATLGGRAETRQRGDFSLNRGAHALYRSGEAAEVLAELGVRFAGASPRGPMRALRGDRLYTLPTSPSSLLWSSLLGVVGKWETAGVLSRLPRLDTSSLAGTTAAEWVQRAATRPDARALLSALVRLSSFVGRLDALDAATGVGQLVKALGGVTYVDDGWGTLVAGLAARAREEGASIHLQTRAVSLLRRPTGTLVVGLPDREIEARQVVVALPMRDAVALVEPLGVALPPAAPAARVTVLDVGLSRLPRPDMPFVLGIDRPLYLSVHSAAARLSPPGGAVVHLVRYDDGDGASPEEALAELEGLLDRSQPGWRAALLERQYLPSVEPATRLDLASGRGAQGRPDCHPAPGLFLAGDWVKGGSWLSDASLGSARAVARRLTATSGSARVAA